MWDLIVSVPYHCLSFYFVLVYCHGNALKFRERGHFTNIPFLPCDETFVMSFLSENAYSINLGYIFLKNTVLIF